MRENACRFFKRPFDGSTYLEYNGVRLLDNEIMNSYTLADVSRGVMPDAADIYLKHIVVQECRRSKRVQDLKLSGGGSGAFNGAKRPKR
jgi:hypothetical protein